LFAEGKNQDSVKTVLQEAWSKIVIVFEEI